MNQSASSVRLLFTCEMDERAEWEIKQKGFFEHVLAHLPDGKTVRVCFWEPVRLSQELEDYLKWGKRCLAEPGMIIIPEVTVPNMEAAVKELYEQDFFAAFVSVE